MQAKIIIKNGFICDGSGTAPQKKDLLIEKGLISAIDEPGTFQDNADCIIDAAGNLVTPGFIDAHSHGETRKLTYPENRSKLFQGVTTEVDGNCGSSSSCVPGELDDMHWNNLAEYVSVLRQRSVSTNTVVLCGHNSIRRQVMGRQNVTVGKDEIKAMKRMIEETFEVGAAGWTSGLKYFPGKFSETAELLELSSVTKGTNKIHATHMRSEGDQLLEALHEAIEVARAGSGRLEISHLKTIFPRNFHKIDQLLQHIRDAQQSGLDVHADRYPYIYTSTRIGQVLPPPYCMDPDFGKHLREGSAEFQEEIVKALEHSPRDLGPTILTKKMKTLAEIAQEKGLSVERACMLELLESPDQNAAFLSCSQENMMTILSQPWVCAGSDGISMQLDAGEQFGGHPRAVGTFPTFFRIVSKLCGVAEAVRRMTALPAQTFRIPQRGLLKPGYIADIVVFDSDKFESKAGFRGEDPMPIGMKYVLVGGNVAWDATQPDKVGRYGDFIPVN